MKVTITGLEPKKKEIDWTKQCLVKSITTGNIVMVTGEEGADKYRFSGTAIQFKGMINTGHSNQWLKENFELLPEDVEITLSNKSE